MNDPGSSYEQNFWDHLAAELLPGLDLQIGEGLQRIRHLRYKLKSDCEHYVSLRIGEAFQQTNPSLFKGSADDYFKEVLVRAHEINRCFQPVPAGEVHWQFWRKPK